MKLISAANALNFLSQAAPRPWITRLLIWMVVNGEIASYAAEGSVRAHVSAFQFLFELAEKAGEACGPKMDAAIREAYAPELAEQLVGRAVHDRVYDEAQGWQASEGPQTIDAGIFFFANEIDWEKGILRAIDIPGRLIIPDFLFPNEELYATDFEDPDFNAEFVDISFDFQAIEMLLPTAQLATSTVTKLDSGIRARASGRPPKWDWEGVLAYVVSQAQQPDGLPTGPGAQARLEELMASWFVGQTGDAPASSQIRQRASSIARLLDKPDTSERSGKPETPKKA
jgi:hypothetical protein